APSLAASHHCPASSRTTSAPPSARTLAAMPPPAPEPTIQTSYSFARLTICMVAPLCDRWLKCRYASPFGGGTSIGGDASAGYRRDPQGRAYLAGGRESIAQEGRMAAQPDR